MIELIKSDMHNISETLTFLCYKTNCFIYNVTNTSEVLIFTLYTYIFALQFTLIYIVAIVYTIYSITQGRKIPNVKFLVVIKMFYYTFIYSI